MIYLLDLYCNCESPSAVMVGFIDPEVCRLSYLFLLQKACVKQAGIACMRCLHSRVGSFRG